MESILNDALPSSQAVVPITDGVMVPTTPSEAAISLADALIGGQGVPVGLEQCRHRLPTNRVDRAPTTWEANSFRYALQQAPDAVRDRSDCHALRLHSSQSFPISRVRQFARADRRATHLSCGLTCGTHSCTGEVPCDIITTVSGWENCQETRIYPGVYPSRLFVMVDRAVCVYVQPVKPGCGTLHQPMADCPLQGSTFDAPFFEVKSTIREDWKVLCSHTHNPTFARRQYPPPRLHCQPPHPTISLPSPLPSLNRPASAGRCRPRVAWAGCGVTSKDSEISKWLTWTQLVGIEGEEGAKDIYDSGSLPRKKHEFRKMPTDICASVVKLTAAWCT